MKWEQSPVVWRWRHELIELSVCPYDARFTWGKGRNQEWIVEQVLVHTVFSADLFVARLHLRLALGIALRARLLLHLEARIVAISAIPPRVPWTPVAAEVQWWNGVRDNGMKRKVQWCNEVRDNGMNRKEKKCAHQQQHIQLHQTGQSLRLRQQQQYNKMIAEMIARTPTTEHTTIIIFKFTIEKTQSGTFNERLPSNTVISSFLTHLIFINFNNLIYFSKRFLTLK